MRPEVFVFKDKVGVADYKESSINETVSNLLMATLECELPEWIYSAEQENFYIEDFIEDHEKCKYQIFNVPIGKGRYLVFSQSNFKGAGRIRTSTVMNQIQSIISPLPFSLNDVNLLAYGYRGKERVSNAYISQWGNYNLAQKVNILKQLSERGMLKLTTVGKKFCERKIESTPMKDSSRWNKQGVVIKDTKDAPQKGLRDLSR